MFRVDRIERFANTILTALIVMVGFAGVSHAQQETRTVRALILDADGTLFQFRHNPDKSLDGTWNTDVRIFRIPERSNLVLKAPTGPLSILVTQKDLHRMKNPNVNPTIHLGVVGAEVVLASGVRIQPAEYHIRYPDSFEFYAEARAGSGRNYLIEDFERAEKRALDTGGTWKGKLWDVFVEWCSTAEGAENVTILTARSHSVAEWDAFFEFLRQRGFIKFKPPAKRTVNVSRDEFDVFGPKDDVAARKAGYLEERVLRLSRVPVPIGEKHVITVGEDDVANHKRQDHLFRTIAMGNLAPVRLVLVNAGSSTDVRNSGIPEISVYETGGKMNVSSKWEKLFRNRRPTESAAVSTCEGALHVGR